MCAPYNSLIILGFWQIKTPEGVRRMILCYRSPERERRVAMILFNCSGTTAPLPAFGNGAVPP